MLKFLLLVNLFTFTAETVPSTPGTYPVKIEYKDEKFEESKIVQLTVISTSTQVYEELAIDAKDFTVGEDVNLTKDLIVRLSKAKAWNTTTGEEYKIEKTQVMKVNDNQYEVILYSFKSISTKINVFVEKDYYSTVSLSEEMRTPFTSTNVYERYAFQFITIITSLAITIIFGLVAIRNYNERINKTVSDFNNSKDSVNKS